MSADEYKIFKHEYLSSFRNTYSHAGRIQKKLLKETVFNNPNLTTKQKEKFWDLVVFKNF